MNPALHRKKATKRIFCLSGIAGAIALTGAPGFAQPSEPSAQSPAPTPVPAQAESGASAATQKIERPPADATTSSAPAVPQALEAVTVTAQRRTEQLQRVPVAVKAFTARQIEDTGIKSTQDFINLTPNMSFDNSFTYGNSFVVIRGVTQINNADSPVAVVVDGVPQSDQKQLKMNLFDVESIEVLKGPQGALYGRNAIGGAIVINTKTPKNDLQGFVTAGVASGNSRDLAGGLTGAIVPDKILFRLVANTKKADGQISNTFLDKKVDEVHHDNDVRGKVTFNLIDDFTLDLRLSSREYKAGATWDSIIRSGNANDITPIRSNTLGSTTGKTNEFTLKAELETGLGTLTAITSSVSLREKFIGDADFSNPSDPQGGILNGIPNPQRIQGQDRKVRLLSQEVRLTSPANRPTRWIAGLFYLNSRRDTLRKTVIDSGSGDSAQWEAGAPSANDRFFGEGGAIFGQLDHDVTKNTTLSGALRYDRDPRHRTNLLNGQTISQTFDAWQPKFTLTHRIDADALVYGTYSTGFRSGGFNSALSVASGFKDEFLRNYEGGYKNSFLDRRLILNVAGFYSPSRNFQYFGTATVNGNQVAQIRNIDKVDIKGLDIDLRYAPLRGLEIDGGVGVTDSRIKQNSNEPTTVGNHAPKASPWKLTLGTQYTKQVGEGVLLFGRFDLEERSKKYWEANNALVSSGLTLFGLRFGVKDANGKWSFNLYGKNIGDKQYYADVNGHGENRWPNAAATAIGSLAPRRTIGMELNYRL